jgi:hypothetical protein
VGHRAGLDVSEKDKYLYVPGVEPRIIEFSIRSVVMCNAAVANAYGDNSYCRSVRVRVRARAVVPLVVLWVGSYTEINSWTSVFVASRWL